MLAFLVAGLYGKEIQKALFPTCRYVHSIIKTHDSESRGQEEAGRTR